MLGALFGFGGRLSRPGYWEVLMSIVLIDVALVIGRMFVADSGLPGGYGPSSPLAQALLQATPWVLGFFTLWSLLAAAIKRCHDRGRTGFLLLVGLIPVFGWLWLLIDLFFLEGSEGRNRYGRAPHAPVADTQSGFTWGADPAPPAAAAAASAFAWRDTPAEGAGHGHDAAHHAPEPAAHDDHGHGAGQAAEVHDDHGHGQASHDHHGDHAGGHDDHGRSDHGHDAHEPAHAEDSHGVADQASEAHGHGDEHHAEPAGGDSHGHDAHASASHGHAAGAGAHASASAIVHSH